MRRAFTLAIAAALALGACGGEADGTFAGADAPVLERDEVRVSVGFDERDCLTFTAEADGYEPLTRTTCSSGYTATVADECLDAEGGPGSCAAWLPAYLYGWAPPTVGWLCLAERDDGVYGPVRFAAPDTAGLFLVPIDEPTLRTPFPYTANGAHWGEPPLDAPAGPIYALCDAAGPWDGPVPAEMQVPVLFRLDPGLNSDDLALLADAGAGPIGLSFGAADNGIVDPGVRILSTSTGLTISLVEVTSDGTETVLGTYPFPQQILDELQSGWRCPDAPAVIVDVSAAVIDGDPDSISIGWVPASEAAEILGFDAPFSAREPGEPCPDNGVPVDAG